MICFFVFFLSLSKIWFYLFWPHNPEYRKKAGIEDAWIDGLFAQFDSVISIINIFCPQFIAEFDLRSVQYEVKSSRCHEMRLAAPPNDCISFNFRCDREAEEWATVVMSSLREAHRGEFHCRLGSPRLLRKQHCATERFFCELTSTSAALYQCHWPLFDFL